MTLGQTLKHFNRSLRVPFNRKSAFKKLAEFHSKPLSMDKLVDWAMKFPSKGHLKVRSSQVRFEIMSLAKVVAEIKPERILEIGTAEGGTLFIWSNLASKKVISCDILEPGVKKSLYKAFPPPATQCKVTNLTGDSHTKPFLERVNMIKTDKPRFSHRRSFSRRRY